MKVDIAVIGAGPAGMSAAIEARRLGASVFVTDNRPEPGGNIYASLTTNRAHHPERLHQLGSHYQDGAALIDRFYEAGADYRPLTSLWHLDQDGTLAVKGPDGSFMVQAGRVILATGAQERPMPMPGWTLPGVMGVGAAQLLLKSSGHIPDGDIIIIGAGPLPLLYAQQVSRMGGRIAAFVEPEGSTGFRRGLAHLPGAVQGSAELFRGLRWSLARHVSRTPVYRNARDIRIEGGDCVQSVTFRPGGPQTLPACTVLLHDGVVPGVNPATGAGLSAFYVPQQDAWHAQSAGVIEVAGDAGGILGARAAVLSGRRAALRALGEDAGLSLDRAIRREQRFRRLIDAVYPPIGNAALADDDTVICRCEMVRAGAIRDLARQDHPDPNRIKSALRSGMGPCQGRMCALSSQAIIARQQQTTPDKIGIARTRSPIVPVTLGDYAEMED